MSPRSLARAAGAAAAVLLVCAVLLAITQRSALPRSCSDTGDPQTAVTELFDALCGGRVSGSDAMPGGLVSDGDRVSGGDAPYVSRVSDCDVMFSGYSSVGLGKKPGTETGRKLYDALLDSYEYSLIGAPKPDGARYLQTVEIRYFDIGATAEELNELSTANLTYCVHMMSADEVYDENNEYREEIVMKALGDAIDTLLKDPEKYYVTERVDVAVELDGTEWKVAMTDDLRRILLGGAE